MANTEVNETKKLIKAYRDLLKIETDAIRQEKLRQWIRQQEHVIAQHKLAGTKRS